MTKLLKILRNLTYDPETGDIINPFTLSISDPEIAAAVRNNFVIEFNKLYLFACVVATVNLLQQIVTYIQGTSDLFFLVNASF